MSSFVSITIISILNFWEERLLLNEHQRTKQRSAEFYRLQFHSLIRLFNEDLVHITNKYKKSLFQVTAIVLEWKVEEYIVQFLHLSS